jgi:hypothetical protein
MIKLETNLILSIAVPKTGGFCWGSIKPRTGNHRDAENISEN